MASTGSRKIAAVEEWVLIALFVLALYLPIMGTTIKIDASPTQQENRTAVPFPSLSLNWQMLREFPDRFKLYFDDNFGFRKLLIRWQAIAKVKWLGISSSKRVIVGREGWLFFAGERSLESYRRTDPLSQEQLARWRQVLEARRDWLAQRGIRYLFTVAPDKHSIYPEYMPPGIVRLGQQSRLDQLIAYLRQHSDIEILDLRPALFEAKTRHRIYHLTDTHWNDYGAFVAYQSIIKEVTKSFPEVQPLPESALEVSRQQTTGKDLATMLGLPDKFTEDDFSVRPRPEFAAEIRGNASEPYELVVAEQKGSGLPRLVMFRDSFAAPLVPFLATHFSRSVFIWNKELNLRLIEAERPGIVIHEIVERYLMLDPPEGPFEGLEH
ncbi:MAG TPA: hypothetical protein VF544_00525 [Pyrinomonadaceae bacterium]|jgi:hypothetical protein